MKASEIMTVGAATIGPDVLVPDAARLMVKYHVSGLPVVDKDGQLVGMLTEGDLLRRSELGTERKRRPRWLEFWVESGKLAEEYVQAHAHKVADVMTQDVVTIAPDSPLSDIVDLMERHHIKRLPVVQDGRVTGIVSRANLMRALARRIEEAPQPLSDDLAIRKHILDEIEDRGWVASGAIDVVVRNGAVELDGLVTSDAVCDAIRIVAESAPGATRVDSKLKVVALESTWI